MCYTSMDALPQLSVWPSLLQFSVLLLRPLFTNPGDVRDFRRIKASRKISGDANRRSSPPELPTHTHFYGDVIQRR